MMNRISLIGRLGGDPEVRQLPSGDSVTNVSLATGYKDKQGNDHTTWFRIAFWDKLGQIAAQYLRKGSQIYVEGPVSARAYADRDGKPAASLEVRGMQMKMLGSKADGAEGRPSSTAAQPAAAAQSAPSQEPVFEADDQIPF